MLLRSKYLPHMRALALLLVSFQVLASARALVPNLCLTQRDAAALAAGCCKTDVPTCCTEEGKAQPHAPLRGENGKCAFCFLAKAYTEAPTLFLHPSVQEVADAPYDRGAGILCARAAGDVAQGRAPPA